MNAIKLPRMLISLLTLAGSAGYVHGRQDHWIYPQSIDDFARPLAPTQQPAAKPVARFHNPPKGHAADLDSALTSVTQDSNAEAVEPKFTARLLVSMKKADRIPARTLARCELEMDECLKDRLGRGFFIARASEACRVEDVCLLPVSLDYAQFTLVSRMIKARTNTNKKHDT